MHDPFVTARRQAADADEVVIALPAEDAHLLIRQVLDHLVSTYDGQSAGVIPEQPLGAAGNHWGASVVVYSERRKAIRLRLFGWDREAGAKKSSWPDAVQGGSWVLVNGGSKGEMTELEFAAFMNAVAARLNGYLSRGFRRPRSQESADTPRWIGSYGSGVFEGLDVPKLRLLRTLGFEAAPVIETILRSDEVRAVMAEVLDGVPRADASPGSVVKA